MPFSSKRKSPQAAVAAGVGYGGDAAADARARKSAKKTVARKAKEDAAQQQKDCTDWKKRLDTEEPSESILRTMKDVFRNQIPSEWSSRRKLYLSALDCCEAVAQKHPKALGDHEDDESLAAALDEFAKHAEMISQHNQSLSNPDKKIVHRILAVRTVARTEANKVLVRPEMAVLNPQEYYRQALRPLRFEIVDKLHNHAFAHTKAKSVQDTRKLFRELATYKTALPIEYGSSIFVRAEEKRLDLLRVLITGPEDTPYAHGCYVFDVSLAAYPRQPPKVQYLTTGGGKYRFNPNLYNEGKVCLSLLGTWSGPGWSAGESTLLQVLVSIQSLILVSDPYFNEPGFQHQQGTPHGTKQSENYNRNVRRMGMEVCVLPFLSYPSPYPEFDKAIQLHFRNKREDVRKELYQWCNDDIKLFDLYQQCENLLYSDCHQRRKKRKVLATLRTMRANKIEGVIALDDSDDDDNNNDDDNRKPDATTAPSGQDGKESEEGHKPSGRSEIELIDLDDDDSVDNDDNDNDNSGQEEPNNTFAAVDGVVDLT